VIIFSIQEQRKGLERQMQKLFLMYNAWWNCILPNSLKWK